MSFDDDMSLEDYINSLPDDVETIDILSHFRRQTLSLNALSRFTNVREFICTNLEWTSLPTLPNTLIILNCSWNKLTSLPALPDTLKELHCFRNEFDFLPVLPNTLKVLHCSVNALTSLPALPNVGSEVNKFSEQYNSCNDVFDNGGREVNLLS